MNNSPDRFDPALARMVTALAGAIALALAIALPLAYFVSERATQYAAIGAEAKLAAVSISQLASVNPELWIFEDARIRGLFAMLGPLPEGEQRMVFAASGGLVAGQGEDLPSPIMTAVNPVYDSGAVIGRVEIRRALRELVAMTGVIALLSTMLGVLAFVVLRSLPLRLLQRAIARSTHLATHDVLTGLPNRALFKDRLEQHLAWARREGSSLAVLYLDLDRFKEVNDTLGHAAGDRLLMDVAARLSICVRDTDTLARLGGDEFAIVQVGVRNIADTETLAERLIDVMNEAFNLDGNKVTVGASVGVALRSMTDLVVSQSDVGTLLQEADVALYRAKEEGRGTYRFFASEMNHACWSGEHCRPIFWRRWRRDNSGCTTSRNTTCTAGVSQVQRHCCVGDTHVAARLCRKSSFPWQRKPG